MAGEEIPKRMWYEIFDRFTRRDELLVEILKDMRALLKKFPPAPPVVITPVPPEVELPTIGVVGLLEKTIKALTERLQQLPNRLDKIDIDTSKTSDISLKKLGKLKADVLLGLWVESIGGEFEYIFQRGEYRSPAKTAVVNDTWDIEYDDLSVAGSGTAGTATIWVWWRE